MSDDKPVVGRAVFGSKDVCDKPHVPESTLAEPDLIYVRKDDYDALRIQLAEKDKEIDRLRGIVRKDSDELDRLRAVIVDREAQLAKRDARIAELREALAALVDKLHGYQSMEMQNARAILAKEPK